MKVDILCSKVLTKPGEIVYTTTDPIESIHEDLVDLSRPDIGKQTLESWTIRVLARETLIRIDAAVLLLTYRQGGFAEVRLLFDRNTVCALHRLPGIDR